MRTRTTWLFLALLAVAAPALAQQGTAEIRGRVVDAQESILPGVTVTVRNQETGMFRQVVSNADGSYFMSGVTPGTYELGAELAGFKKYARRDVRLEIGKTSSVDIRLEVGGLEEQLTITAEAPIVDVSSKEVGANITSRELLDLPGLILAGLALTIAGAVLMWGPAANVFIRQS